MGALQYLFIHNFATPPQREVTAEDIHQWHIVENGWSRVGYEKIFQLNGNVIDLVDSDADQWVTSEEMTNGVKGFNSISKHWGFAGGLNEDGTPIFSSDPMDLMTLGIWHSLRRELNKVMRDHPQIKIVGHSQASKKSCPGFSVPDYLRLIGAPKQFIKEGRL